MALNIGTDTPIWRWSLREELRDLDRMGIDRWKRVFKIKMESEAMEFDREMYRLQGQETEAALNRRRRNNVRRRIAQFQLQAFILHLHAAQLGSI